METEYLTKRVQRISDLQEVLNSLSQEGWTLHTVLDWGNGETFIIMEGAKASEPESEHEPMRMKGYVHT